MTAPNAAPQYDRTRRPPRRPRDYRWPRDESNQRQPHPSAGAGAGAGAGTGMGMGMGVGVDYWGGPVVDPTYNVLQLVEASNKRQDDLREANNRLYDDAFRHMKEIQDSNAAQAFVIGEMRASHQKELNHAESARIDSIRAVDREEVAKTAMSANQAIATLAAQTTSLAVTLRSQVDTVAQSVENRQVVFADGVNKRISALELAMSEGKGKATVADPQIERLTESVQTLVRMQAADQGKQAVNDPRFDKMAESITALTNTVARTGGNKEGVNATWVMIGGGAALFLTMLTIGGILLARNPGQATAVAPQALYAPVPAPVTIQPAK